MIFPKQLQIGDTIGLVAPASPVSTETLEACKKVITSMGYKVIVGEHCTKKIHGYLAGEDKERASDINEMFLNDEINGIFCLRGGYGTGRIMHLLDYEKIKQNPKIFVGYSDITNLNMAFTSHCNFVTFHGPMVSSNMLEHYDTYTMTCFREVLGMGQCYKLENPVGKKFEIISTGNATGEASGRVIGGNLSVLINMLGTFYAPNFQRKILFIEDVNETIPRINRMFDQLYYTGIMNQVEGILIGDFAHCNNPSDENFHFLDLVREYFHGFHKPVIAGIQCGHSFPTATIPLGTVCKMNANRETITFFR